MGQPSRKIAAATFKAECLGILDRVAKTGETVIVTKHGKPVAKVVPLNESDAPAPLLGSVTFHGDILLPIDEIWDAER